MLGFSLENPKRKCPGMGDGVSSQMEDPATEKETRKVGRGPRGGVRLAPGSVLLVDVPYPSCSTRSPPPSRIARMTSVRTLARNSDAASESSIPGTGAASP